MFFYTQQNVCQNHSIILQDQLSQKIFQNSGGHSITSILTSLHLPLWYNWLQNILNGARCYVHATLVKIKICQRGELHRCHDSITYISFMK